MRIDEIEGSNRPSRENALNAWRQMQMNHAESRNKDNSNKTTIRSNREDLIDGGNVHDSASAGAGGVNALITASQSADQSGGQNFNQSNSQGQRDSKMISNIAMAKEGGLKVANQISFADMDPEAVQVNRLRNSLIEQTSNRLGITLNPDDIQGMDATDLQSAIRSMAQQTRPAQTSPEVGQFMEMVNHVSPDFFEAIDTENLYQA